MYFYELHLHTSETSRCGQSTAREMVTAYKEKGFTGLVVTDHFVNGYSRAAFPETWKEKMDAFVKGYYAAKEAGDELGLKVYFGLEYTADRPAGEDYLALGLKPEHLYKEFVDCDQWTIEQFIDQVHALGGIVVRAHPYRVADYMSKKAQERPGLPIDAVEVFNGGNTKELYNLQALEMAIREGKPIGAGSDTHTVETTATDYIGFAQDPADYAALCAAIKNGDAAIVHQPRKE